MIVFAHLLNDASGSPRVLIESMRALQVGGFPVRLHVGRGSGCLSGLGIPTVPYWYRRSRFRPLTLLAYLFSQVLLFFRLLCDRSIDRGAVVYVNTLLPFGAAIFGRLTGRPVLYHVHEISIRPAVLRWWLVSVARWTSHLNLYVSEAHRVALPIPGVPARRVYNALSASFADRAGRCRYASHRGGGFNVLMVASLRPYKGVHELLALCERLRNRDDVRFELVVNDSDADVARFFRQQAAPANLRVHPCAADTLPFYARASLLLNLSRVDLWVETFGLTVLEAMACGVPVIVPPVGGPTELVECGVEGYRVDSRDLSALEARVRALADDPGLCSRMSAAARRSAACFSEAAFANGIREAVNAVMTGSGR